MITTQMQNENQTDQFLRLAIEKKEQELAKTKLRIKKVLEHQRKIYNFMYSKLSEQEKLQVDIWEKEKELI